VRHLGHCLAGWDFSDGVCGIGWSTTSEQFNVPGRMAAAAADAREPGRAGAFLVFTAPPVTHDWHDTTAHKAKIKRAFDGPPWHVPYLLSTPDGARDPYFDSISRVSVPQWTRGRIALLGDAAWGLVLGGMGVGTGLVGA
jgi:2-polyprenyl-6-methoxyphenol hydroxylase-like FAD-dependent oxidoreductase